MNVDAKDLVQHALILLRGVRWSLGELIDSKNALGALKERIEEIENEITDLNRLWDEFTTSLVTEKEVG